MHINHRYLLDRATKFAKGGRVLDFGAGAGEFVLAAHENGLDAYGVDTYPPEMGNYRKGAEESGIFGSYLRSIEDGSIPFPDDHFDVVLSNMVFEHIFDLEPVLAEIDRVLKPGGTVISIFPSVGVFREGHIGIPFAHWFQTGSRAQYAYILAVRSLGVGRLTQGRTRREWARRSAWRLQNTIVYRRHSELVRAFSDHFDWSQEERRYLRFRLEHSRLRPLARLADVPLLGQVGAFFIRSWMGMIVVSKKPAGHRAMASAGQESTPRSP